MASQALSQILYSQMTFGSEVARFAFILRNWRAKILEPKVLAMSNVQKKKFINKWLNEMEYIFQRESLNINLLSSFKGWAGARTSLEMTTEIDIFLDSYKSTITALSTKDLTQARLLRNSLAEGLGKDKYIDMYDEYDDFTKTSYALGLSQSEKVNAFENLGGKKYTSFIDSSGRLWKPDDYARMYSNTRGSEMYNTLIQDELIANEADIVRVSSHRTGTPICQQYEGKIYSIMGMTPGLPILEVQPPFHPNCKHILQPRPHQNIRSARRTNVRLNKMTTNERAGWTQAQKKTVKKQTNWIKTNRPAKAAI